MHVLRVHKPLRLPLSVSLLFSVASQMIWWASPAEAQGFFQQLFGLSPAPQVQTRPPSGRAGASISGAPMPFSGPAADRQGRPGRIAPEGSGGYTTVCVRMCDGFYFPVSHRVPRSRFHRDADICRERCPRSEARLFYHSSAGGSMGNAVDLTGRAYARLPIAFRHRKQLVAGCGCKPEPWSVEALALHEGYAIAAGLYLPGRTLGVGPVTVVAGNYPDTPAASAGEAGGAGAPGGDGETRAAAAETGEDRAEDRASATSGSGDGTQSEVASREAQPALTPGHGANARSAPLRTTRPAPRPVQRQATRPQKAVRAKTAAVGLFGGGGGSGLVWPGDAPSRTR
jgi:hypothetical protein